MCTPRMKVDISVLLDADASVLFARTSHRVCRVARPPHRDCDAAVSTPRPRAPRGSSGHRATTRPIKPRIPTLTECPIPQQHRNFPSWHQLVVHFRFWRHCSPVRSLRLRSRCRGLKHTAPPRPHARSSASPSRRAHPTTSFGWSIWIRAGDASNQATRAPHRSTARASVPSGSTLNMRKLK